MAQRQGNDIMQLILGLAQIKQQREDMAQRAQQNERTTKLSWLATALPIARASIDPSQLTSLAAQGEELGVGKQDQLLHMLSNIQPEQEVIRSYRARMGLAALDEPTSVAVSGQAADMVTSGQTTGQRAGSDYVGRLFSGEFESGSEDEANARVMKALTATQGRAGPSGVVEEHAVAGLPMEFFQQKAVIGGGLAPTAAQTAQLQQGARGLQLQERGLDIQAGSLDLAIEQARQRAAEAMAAASSPEGIGLDKLPSLLDTKATLQNTYMKSTAPRTEEQVRQYLYSLMALDDAIVKAGGQAPIWPKDSQGQFLPPDVRQMKRGLLGGF